MGRYNLRRNPTKSGKLFTPDMIPVSDSEDDSDFDPDKFDASEEEEDGDTSSQTSESSSSSSSSSEPSSASSSSSEEEEEDADGEAASPPAKRPKKSNIVRSRSGYFNDDP